MARPRQERLGAQEKHVEALIRTGMSDPRLAEALRAFSLAQPFVPASSVDQPRTVNATSANR